MYRRILALCCVFFVAITQSGCIGLIVNSPEECKNETPITGMPRSEEAEEASLKGSTKAEFLKDWGEPDEIISTSKNEESWIYNRKLWCGVIPVFLLPVPLILPVCDGFDRIEFQGDEAKSLHTRHTVMAGLVLPYGPAGADPACRLPLPPNNGVNSDASSPTMTWQTYNMLTKERDEIMKDGQSIDVPSDEQYVVTLAVEDLNSGVKDVTLSGNVQYACEQGGQVENKKFPLETQKTKPTPDQENKGPVRAALVYSVEFGKMGCKEGWMFGGGKLSLMGKAHNFVGGAGMRTLHVNLKQQLSR